MSQEKEEEFNDNDSLKDDKNEFFFMAQEEKIKTIKIVEVYKDEGEEDEVKLEGEIIYTLDELDLKRINKKMLSCKLED